VFYDGIPSDHRRLFIDLLTELIYRPSLNQPLLLSSGTLYSTSLKSSRRYRYLLMKYFDDHKIESRLTEVANLQSTDTAIALESINRDITQGMLAAEKRCSPKPGTAFDSSLH
jgi:hypothetical protein